MSCRSVNLTKEELINARKNGTIAMSPLLNQTSEETISKLDNLNNIVSLDVEKHKYSLFGDIELKTSVSENAKRKSGLREQNTNPDNIIKREGGTFIHTIMRDLMDLHFNGKGDITEIRNKALNGSTKLTQPHFKELSLLAETLTKDIRKQQEQIDPKGKVEIRLESFIADFLKDIGGTVDVLAVFSDNTASLYDYKTTGKEGSIGFGKQGQEVTDTLFPYTKLNAYDLSMSEYKRILLERVGIKAIRQNRLLPIAVNYKYKKEGTEGNLLRPEVNVLLTQQKQNDFLKPIPVGGEQSRWEGITKLVEKQLRQQTILAEELKKGGLTQEQRDHLQARISNINRSVMRTLVDEDIYDITQTIANLAIEAETRLNEVQTLPSGEANPAFLSMQDLTNFRDELAVYDDIINETHSYFTELKESDPEKFSKLKESLYTVYPALNDAKASIAFELTKRSEDMVRSEYKDENGHLLPLEELSPGQLLFLKISEIDNPVFKSVWKVIETAQYDIKQKYNNLDKDVYGKLENLYKWAKDNHIDRLDALKIMINQETGNMYSKLDPKFYEKLKNAVADKTDKGLTFIRENYEFRDKEAFKKDYATRLEGFKATEKARYNNFKPTIDITGRTIKTAKSQKESYDKAIESWITNNDLIGSKQAWVSSVNRRRYLKLKEETQKANYSAEYNKIRSIKPVHEFYEMWNNYMEDFADILGITSYKELPPNFIPNIRKEVMEHLGSDGFHIAAAVGEMMEAFSVREEDIYLGTADEDGFTRKIPILFLNKIHTKDGKVDNTRKSYDLSKSLMLFGHMAYSYQHMSEIEPKINALKDLLGNPTPEQGGIQSTDRLGRKIKGRVQPFLTKEGRMTETYKLLNDITDFYLYGIKFKEKSLIPGTDTVHKLTKVKNLNSVIKLSFAIIPAAGAYVAGKVGTRFNAVKGIAYTSKQLNETTKLQVTNPEKYKELTEFFDPENDSYVERSIQKHKYSTKNKIINARTGFYPLRVADKHITAHILVAMSQNYGVTPEGLPIRLNRKGIDATKYKTIADSLVKDKDGKISIEGLSKDGFIQFRAAVKAAAGEIIGNMNSDDIGRVDTGLLMNQMMAFKSWLPALVQEYTGGLRWDETSQAMRWGRFAAYLSDYKTNVNYTAEELENGKYMYSYLSRVVLPNMGKLVLDLTTFGLAPRLGMTRINEIRAQREFLKFQIQNPGLRETVSYDDFLEIKEGQMKAMLVQMRVILGVMALAMFLGGKGPDDKPRYMSNFMTRDLYKIFAKAGSELTFMWNPAEFIRIIKNPMPITGLLVDLKNTVFNGFDESRDLMFGENRKGDPTPAGYYMLKWMPGAPQMSRFLELYKNMEKSPYGVYSQQTN